MRDDFSRLVGGLSQIDLLAEPAAGRTVARIVGHVVEADAAYLRATVGKIEGLLDATKAVLALPEDLLAPLDNLWRVGTKRLAAMTEEERTRQVPHGQVTWTARRGLRRMLEHQWEHLVEVAARLDVPVA
jgi:hypothetical protein